MCTSPSSCGSTQTPRLCWPTSSSCAGAKQLLLHALLLLLYAVMATACLCRRYLHWWGDCYRDYEQLRAVGSFISPVPAPHQSHHNTYSTLLSIDRHTALRLSPTLPDWQTAFGPYCSGHVLR
jgi:hypothetical protein